MTTHATRFHRPLPVPRDADLGTRLALSEAWLRSMLRETEWPAGSNRGPLPDWLADILDEPRGLSWCARTQGGANRAHGLWTPPRDVGDCDAWRHYAERDGLWVDARGLDLSDLARAPRGAVALYTTHAALTVGPYARYRGPAGGARFNAVHAGRLTGFDPGGARLDIEGNASSTQFDPNGGALVEKPVSLSRLYGVVRPALAA